jgi:8-oxo-dGTP pyrophosphatase MutT (NUDIX family)
MNGGQWHLTIDGSRVKTARRPKAFALGRLRRQRGRQQVAAVCYRLRNGNIEFLLVQTRNGRWTFPKGGVKSGLTYAQSAALEAAEEAGVHGRIDETAFSWYVRRSRGNADELPVRAYLCEVSRLVPALEAKRRPTWFSREKTKDRLRSGRSSADAAEFARVVDRAVERLRRLRGQPRNADDALQSVHLEAPGMQDQMRAAFFRYVRRQSFGAGRTGDIEIAVNGYLGRVFGQRSVRELIENAQRFSAERSKPRLLASGSEEVQRKVRYIDGPRPTTTGKKAPGAGKR